MTVKELIETNQLITDVIIEIRLQGHVLIDCLHIGPDAGIIPPYPTMVPKDKKYVGNFSEEFKKVSTYILKNINAWDEGKDYWQVKTNKIPSRWLDLEVFSWESRPAYFGHHPRANHDGHKSNGFYGQAIKIIALPAEDMKAEENVCDTNLEGQMNIYDFIN